MRCNSKHSFYHFNIANINGQINLKMHFRKRKIFKVKSILKVY